MAAEGKRPGLPRSRGVLSYWRPAAALSLLAVCVFPFGASAHPVPRENHDRVIGVRLTGAGVVVDYRLDVDDTTAVYLDLPELLSRAEIAELTSERALYQAYMDRYAPILGANLIAAVDGGEPLAFECVQQRQRFRDENGQKLDHLRFEFRFRAAWPAGLAGRHRLNFREGNYQLQEGLVALTLGTEPPVETLDKTEPDRSLHDKTTRQLRLGDDDRRRRVSATFVLPGGAAPAPGVAEEAATGEAAGHSSLLSLLLDPGRGLWVLLALAAGLGAVHALTPGHGKTLVAAYLVGERGTVGHALFLGLVTTVTHTGGVIVLAFALLMLYPRTGPNGIPAQVQTTLGLVGGLLIAGMGFWLLLRRLGGQADHVHLGGQGHHHHHGPADHFHDADGPAHPLPAPGAGVWGLVVLGISGGIIPCWDAIAMFGFAVTARRLWLALPLLLAFSAGLAGVLIATGILVVRFKGLAAARWENARLIRALPVVSAVLVTVLGLWLCYDSVHAPGG